MERTEQPLLKTSDLSEITAGTAELVISNDNLFVEKLNALKEFSEQLPQETNLPTVPHGDAIFGWFDHGVTGNELNRLTEEIQVKMIEQNKTIVKAIQEFSAVYDTFAALDKVYVQHILCSIAGIKATNKKIGKQQEELSSTQHDIGQVINQQKQIIQVLKAFKEKLEKLSHLYDVDKIYQANQELVSKIERLEKALAEREERICVLSDRFSVLDKTVARLSGDSPKYTRLLSKSFIMNRGIPIASALISLAVLILFLLGMLR